jgi:hypothetical protein
MQMLIYAFFNLVCVALAVATVSITVTKAAIFKVPRSKIGKLNSWLNQWITCPYCFSHWVSLFFVWWADIILPITKIYWKDYIISVLACVVLSSFFGGNFIIKAYSIDEEVE